jgi:hypothetical protein
VEVPEEIADVSGTSPKLRAGLGPLGEVAAVSLTSPVKPLTLFTVIVEVPLAPAGTDMEAGMAVRLKSTGDPPTNTTIGQESEIVPLDT